MAAGRTQWMTTGDRSHPNLIELDSLTLTYPNWLEDVAKAEEAHTSVPLEFEEKLFKIKEKQRMHDGNRSHPRLTLLDGLELTYLDWERDFAKAEEYHVSLPNLFIEKVSGMKEKQKMSEGDRSHPNLVELDALELTYPGWQDDVSSAEEAHTSEPFMFREKLSEIKEKQKMHEGDRSHPRLVVLDRLRLGYPGWQRDFKKAEDYHVKFPELFEGKVLGMKEKQKMCDGDRSHPNLVQLDSLQLTYPSWPNDVTKAEEAHTHMPLEFQGRLFEIKEKQKMHVGDRSHPRLAALDSLLLTYPGWERDKTKAEQYHVRWFPKLFEGKLSGIREKQRIYCGGETKIVPFREEEIMETLPSAGEKSSNSQIGECVVCYQFSKSHAFVPCGHLCVCQNCVRATMEKRKCPICRQPASQAIKVFFS